MEQVLYPHIHVKINPHFTDSHLTLYILRMATLKLYMLQSQLKDHCIHDNNMLVTHLYSFFLSTCKPKCREETPTLFFFPEVPLANSLHFVKPIKYNTYGRVWRETRCICEIKCQLLSKKMRPNCPRGIWSQKQADLTGVSAFMEVEVFKLFEKSQSRRERERKDEIAACVQCVHTISL